MTEYASDHPIWIITTCFLQCGRQQPPEQPVNRSHRSAHHHRTIAIHSCLPTKTGNATLTQESVSTLNRKDDDLNHIVIFSPEDDQEKASKGIFEILNKGNGLTAMPRPTSGKPLKVFLSVMIESITGTLLVYFQRPSYL